MSVTETSRKKIKHHYRVQFMHTWHQAKDT